jgi:hypothetical protein
MATRTRKSTPAVETEEVVEATTAEPTVKRQIAQGIDRFLDGAGLDVQHARYKVMRAIAFQAFSEAIEAGDFDALVDRAIANADELPTGWGLERSVKEEAEKPAPKAKATAKAKAPVKKTAAKTATKAPARKRPQR